MKQNNILQSDMKKINIVIFQMKIYIYNLKFDKHFFLSVDVRIYDISKKYNKSFILIILFFFLVFNFFLIFFNLLNF